MGGTRTLLVAVACATALMSTLAASAATEEGELLPDLDTSLGIPWVGSRSGHVYLTFTARVVNLGAGPLVLRGHRATEKQPLMAVDQVVERSDGTEHTIPGVSTFAYDASYARWGLIDYLRYTLKRSGGPVASTGPVADFCVLDWTSVPASLQRAGMAVASSRRFTGCGEGKPGLLQLEEGISAGWVNQHTSGRKGQLVELSSATVPSGTYVLTQRVNPNGRLRESTTANNASSVLLKITWKQGRRAPVVRRLKSCPDSAVCVL